MKHVLGIGALLCVLAGAPVAAAVTSRQLVEIADISGPVVSPDGQYVAFRVEQASVERNMYDSVWYVQRMDGEEPAVRVADGGVPLRDSAGESLQATVEWSPDGRWIYYRALIDGRVDVWRAAPDGGWAEPVTQDAADVRAFALSADGRRLMYSIGASREEVIDAELAEYDRGIRIERNVPIGQSLFRSSNVDGRWATQRYDGVGFNRTALLSDRPDRWQVIDLATGSRRAALRSEVPPKPTSPAELAGAPPGTWKLAVDPMHGRIALLTRTGELDGLLYPPQVRLSLLPAVHAQRAVVCDASACSGRNVTGIRWRPGTDELVFTVTNEELAQSVYRWNVATGAVHSVTRSSGLISGSRAPYTECGYSRQAIACVLAEAGRPPRLERIDLDSGERKVLFAPNTALARALSDRPVEVLRWTDSHGQTFTGQYFRANSADGSASPLFVNYYNCWGFLRGGVGDEMPMAVFAEKGISSLCINMAPLRTDVVERYDQALSGTAAAIELLASRGEVDRSRVGMGGLSYGTSVTMWIAVHSNFLAAASVASGMVSPTYYLWGSMMGEDFTSSLKELWGLGSPEETPDRWRAVSPAFNVDRIRAPVLFQMPEQEYLLALDYVIPLLKRDRADLYVFPGEPHQKFQPKHKLAVYERNVDWFRFWLQGYEDEIPSKRRDYANWRVLRDAQSGCEPGERGSPSADDVPSSQWCKVR